MNAMPPLTLPTREIMGVSVVAATAAEAIAALDAARDRGARIKLAFMNAHTSNLAGSDAGYKDMLARFTIINDGVGLDIASRVLHGARFPENLNGTDFIPRYLSETKRPARLFLLGAKPGVAEEAASAIRKLAPAHAIAGVRDGYFDPADGAAIARDVREAGATIVLVAMGNPAQERFIDSHFAAMGAEMAIGVGALFDFLSGRVSRAPVLFRRLRMEWVYRLALEPGRLWRRYILGNFKFISRLLWARVVRRRQA